MSSGDLKKVILTFLITYFQYTRVIINLFHYIWEIQLIHKNT